MNTTKHKTKSREERMNEGEEKGAKRKEKNEEKCNSNNSKQQLPQSNQINFTWIRL